MIVVYLAAKLLELVFLLISLGILAFGLYEIVASAWLYAKGTAVEGRVTGVYQEGGGSYRPVGSMTSVSSSPLRFPTIEYEWPPGSGKTAWIESLVPRGDLEKGDRVTVRVPPSFPDAARADKSAMGHALAAGALAFGLVMSVVIGSIWYGLDGLFGWPTPEGGVSILHGPAGWRLTALIFGPAVVILLLCSHYVPWIQVSDYPKLTHPRALLLLAEERGGAPVDGPLNEYERRLLSLPMLLGTGIATDAFERAFSDRSEPERYERYLRAIGDPDIKFPLDMTHVSWLLMERGPLDRLERFLESGVTFGEATRKVILDIANQQNKRRRTQVLEILEKHGIKGSSGEPL